MARRKTRGGGGAGGGGGGGEAGTVGNFSSGDVAYICLTEILLIGEILRNLLPSLLPSFLPSFLPPFLVSTRFPFNPRAIIRHPSLCWPPEHDDDEHDDDDDDDDDDRHDDDASRRSGESPSSPSSPSSSVAILAQVILAQSSRRYFRSRYSDSSSPSQKSPEYSACQAVPRHMPSYSRARIESSE